MIMNQVILPQISHILINFAMKLFTSGFELQSDTQESFLHSEGGEFHHKFKFL